MDKTYADKYPLHTKMKGLKKEVQVLSEFLDFLEEKGAMGDPTCWGERPYLCMHTKEYIIGDFLEVDPKALSAERDAMYAELIGGK